MPVRMIAFVRPDNFPCFYRYARYSVRFDYDPSVSYRNPDLSVFLVASEKYSRIFAVRVNTPIFPAFRHTESRKCQFTQIRFVLVSSKIIIKLWSFPWVFGSRLVGIFYVKTFCLRHESRVCREFATLYHLSQYFLRIVVSLACPDKPR